MEEKERGLKIAVIGGSGVGKTYQLSASILNSLDSQLHLIQNESASTESNETKLSSLIDSKALCSNIDLKLVCASDYFHSNAYGAKKGQMSKRAERRKDAKPQERNVDETFCETNRIIAYQIVS